MRTRLPLLGAAMWLVACASAPPRPAAPTAPTAPAASAPAPAAPAPHDPFAVRKAPREELPPPEVPPAPVAPIAKLPPGVAPAPKTCRAWVERKAAPKTACDAKPAALAALDAALAVADEAARDAALAAVEDCPALAAGSVRALRLALAPTACGDVLADAWLRGAKGELDGEVAGALRGHALAARLSRTVVAPPAFAGARDKASVAAFVQGPLARWMREEAAVVEALAREAVALPAYGRGVAAIEAALADFRFVEVARAVPVPDEFANDAELRDAYLGALEQSLDPRKDRGRDAALVGLRDLTLVGVLADARADRARALLAALYGGRRVDALDSLLMPPLPPAPSGRVEERLARALPAFFAGKWLDPALALDAGVLRALLDRGLPAPHRLTLDRAASLPGDVARLGARGRLMLATRAWRATDVERAIALAAPRAGGAPEAAEDRLALAVALALRGGPDDAAEMMRRAPGLSLGAMGDTTALDEVSAEPAPIGAMAAFDAALVRAVARPDEAGTAWWREVAARYRRAAAGLDGAARAEAERRAQIAEERAEGGR